MKTDVENFKNVKWDRKSATALYNFALKKHLQELSETCKKDGSDNVETKKIMKLSKHLWHQMFFNSLDTIEQKSESPLETQLGYALMCGMFCVSPIACVVPPPKLLALMNEQEKFPDTETFEITKVIYIDQPDFWLMPNMWVSKKIRVDFGLMKLPFTHKDGKNNLIIIECDSFQYHANPEGFHKDKKRERELVKLGYPIFRFSGREILDNSTKVVTEICEFLNKTFY